MEKIKSWSFYFLYLLVALLPYLGFLYLRNYYKEQLEEIENAKFIVISKEDMSLSVFDYKGNLCFSALIACGKSYGNKLERGDMKTPEGIFHISEIVNSKEWKHDFGDGKGEVAGAYGPYFIRLNVPGHKGIGIHGTYKPESIGYRDTEGCIRLRNNDLEILMPLVTLNMVVIITPSMKDLDNMHQFNQ